jgi:hypothetical protein
MHASSPTSSSRDDTSSVARRPKASMNMPAPSRAPSPEMKLSPDVVISCANIDSSSDAAISMRDPESERTDV